MSRQLDRPLMVATVIVALCFIALVYATVYAAMNPR